MSGQPRLHPKAIGLGLAAGLLGELMLSGHLDIAGGIVTLIDTQSPADVLAHSTLAQILAKPRIRDVRTRTVLFDAGTHADSVHRLRAWVAALPLSLRDLIAQTEAAIGTLVLTHRA